MKKNLLLSAIFMILAPLSWSQPNHNTTWSAYDDLGNFLSYFKFHNDTISSSPDNITYTPESYFFWDGSTVILADRTGMMCPTSDTGHYFITTNNDTMIFIYAGDPCLMRQLFYAQYFYVRYPTTTSIDETPLDQITVTNPFDEAIIIRNAKSKYTFTLFDASGRLLKEESYNDEVIIDAAYLTSGIYYYTLKNDGGIRSGRLVKN
jgi:hypothetical protein